MGKKLTKYTNVHTWRQKRLYWDCEWNLRAINGIKYFFFKLSVIKFHIIYLHEAVDSHVEAFFLPYILQY